MIRLHRERKKRRPKKKKKNELIKYSEQGMPLKVGGRREETFF